MQAWVKALFWILGAPNLLERYAFSGQLLYSLFLSLPSLPSLSCLLKSSSYEKKFFIFFWKTSQLCLKWGYLLKYNIYLQDELYCEVRHSVLGAENVPEEPAVQLDSWLQVVNSSYTQHNSWRIWSWQVAWFIYNILPLIRHVWDFSDAELPESPDYQVISRPI